MKIGIIGAGRVGCALAIGLKNKGFEITGLYSRNADSVEFLNGKLGTEYINDLYSTVNNSEVIFLTVPDNEINMMAIDISLIIPNLKEKVFFHCSGAATSDELSPLKQLGAITASLHPIQTFSEKENGLTGLEGIYYGYEGEEKSNDIVREIVGKFDGKILNISKENKILYHAAATIISNYLNTLSYAAGELFKKAGIDNEMVLKAFKPLVERTLKNIELQGNLNALTGPVSRGDIKTVAAHLEGIKEMAPEVLNIYKVLGEMTTEMAFKKGSISSETAERLKDMLK